ncbi:MAG TPA: hypothetical protein PLV68_12465, partial [Ilumatobacteraceae bacterium]|nr:hypothetical protein [Ilumatobacteraceae bacterium]
LVMMRPSITAYASWIGLSWLRVVEASCNTDFQGAMLTYLINNSRCRVAVVDRQYLPRFVAVAATTPGLETVIVVGGDGAGSDGSVDDQTAGAGFQV